MEKHSVSRLSYLFAHLHLLSSYSFFSDLLSTNLPLLSASALLCFSSVHIVGSLTSKLPSITSYSESLYMLNYLSSQSSFIVIYIYICQIIHIYISYHKHIYIYLYIYCIYISYIHYISIMYPLYPHEPPRVVSPWRPSSDSDPGR